MKSCLGYLLKQCVGYLHPIQPIVHSQGQFKISIVVGGYTKKPCVPNNLLFSFSIVSLCILQNKIRFGNVKSQVVYH